MLIYDASSEENYECLYMMLEVRIIMNAYTYDASSEESYECLYMMLAVRKTMNAYI